MSEPSTPGYGAAGWQVTGQEESQDIAQGGQITDGMRVYFRTPSGVEASVFVSRQHYTPDVVRAAIAAKVATIEAVHQLNG